MPTYKLENAMYLMDTIMDIMDVSIGPRSVFFDESGESPIKVDGDFTNRYVYWLENMLHDAIKKIQEIE